MPNRGYSGVASFAIAIVLAALGQISPLRAANCESLISTSLANAQVTSALTVQGRVVGPDGKDYSGLPSFCSVSVLARPSPDSAINILLWMPASNWTGRFEGTGNGGYAGNMAIDALAMVYAVKHGIAVAASDMGTAPSSNNNGDVLVGHPEKWIDFGHRATHVMTEISKDLIRAFYGRGARFSYFNGCSTGGQQALMTAQRYPNDYDGILGGDPAHDRTHVHTSVAWIYTQTHKTAKSYITPDLVNLITTSVINACLARSGGVPGDAFLNDPSRCNWSPASLACKNGAVTNCLNPDQVRAAKAIYEGATDPVTGKAIFPGSVRGSENASSFGWNDTQSGNEPQFDSLFKWVFGLQWQVSQFDYHQSMRDVDSVLATTLNANNPNLDRFSGRNGKLLMYQGWADPLVAPGSLINYYVAVATRLGGGTYTDAGLSQTQSFFRLFMVPGMNHCAGGAGPNSFGNQFSGTIVVPDPPSDDAAHHALTALIRWVEKGVPPSRITATKYVNDLPQSGIQMQRPLCLYPLVAKYKGQGSTADAANFACVRGPGMPSAATVSSLN